jgi:ubiquinone/menaquinone biosynthesis C-methylase UbiE
MPTPPEPSRKELASTYFVQDRQNEEELRRLTIQDQMITSLMGGVLPEQPDPTVFHRVLDVGCGSGGWAIEAAQVYPTMSVFGIDISARMVDYARRQAEAAGVADRVEFAVMDALMYLEFPPGHFDLVNLRLGISFMRTWDWPKLLGEMTRVTRRGGVIRVTDEEVLHLSNSPALARFNELLLRAFFQAGHLFAQETTGLSAHLARLLSQHGCQQVQTRAYPLTFSAGTPQGEAYYKDVVHFFHIMRPFLKRWGGLPKDYDLIMQQALEDMPQPDFWATWNLLTAWGINSQAPQWPRRD